MKTATLNYIRHIVPILLIIANTQSIIALELVNGKTSTLDFNGYMRTGVGYSGDGGIQTDFVIPETQSKYRLGNESDHYLELTLKYNQLIGQELDKSFDLVWTGALYKSFGEDQPFSPTYAAELYIKFNNIFGSGKSFWFGRRYYERRAIDMLDRYWLNTGQTGNGIGVENILDSDGIEDVKVALFSFSDRNLLHYNSESERSDYLFNYTADVRWVGKEIKENTYFNLAANYTIRPKNEELGYQTRHGFGLASWIDYEEGLTKNCLSAVFRYGASVVSNHGSGRTIVENTYDDRRIIVDLKDTYYFEASNDFTYDNAETYAITAVALFMAQDFGTDPYWLEEDGSKTYYPDLGRKLYWFTLGARNIFYLTDNIRLNLELSSEYAIINHLDTDGFLNKITFIPEFALKKGINQRPVLRPFITYACWSDGLKGYIGSSPTGADSYINSTNGFTFGIQFEMFW